MAAEPPARHPFQGRAARHADLRHQRHRRARQRLQIGLDYELRRNVIVSLAADMRRTASSANCARTMSRRRTLVSNTCSIASVRFPPTTSSPRAAATCRLQLRQTSGGIECYSAVLNRFILSRKRPAPSSPRAGCNQRSICGKWRAFCAAVSGWWRCPLPCWSGWRLSIRGGLHAIHGDIDGAGRSAPRQCGRDQSVGAVEFGTDDATIESQTLLIQSVAILERVVRKLKLTDDQEFTPRPACSTRSGGVQQQRTG